MRFFQLELDWRSPAGSAAGTFELEGLPVPVLFRRNTLARRYRLYVDRDGRPRVTIPRRGSRREAERFVRQHRDWLARQLQRAAVRRASDRSWRPGTEVFFRGEKVRLELIAHGDACRVQLGPESFPASGDAAGAGDDLRPVVEAHLRSLAGHELPPRVAELAGQHGSPVHRVTVRNQRSRWGSCSRRGTISLNWRLVQTPVAVRDYIIVHELMHLREMNHSPRFWAHVEAACPEFEVCEQWLRRNGGLIL